MVTMKKPNLGHVLYGACNYAPLSELIICISAIYEVITLRDIWFVFYIILIAYCIHIAWSVKSNVCCGAAFHLRATIHATFKANASPLIPN